MTSYIAHYPWHRSYRWQWLARAAVAWGVLTGRWTLSEAWQQGYDQHVRDELLSRAFNPNAPVYNPRNVEPR